MRSIEGNVPAALPRSRAAVGLWDLPDRRLVMVASLAAGAGFVLVLTLLFVALGTADPPASEGGAAPSGGTAGQAAAGAPAPAVGLGAARLGVLVLDFPSKHFPYPITFQNLMHLLFFLGLGELFVRWRVAERELGFLGRGYLPEDEETVLQFPDLGAIRRRVARTFDGEHGFLPSLIDLSVLQFQSSRSVDQTVAVMNNALGLIEHRVDLRYGLIRFLAWMVPTLGFLGTVYSLGASLYEAGASTQISVQETARTLGVGFDTTMVALTESAILVFLMHLAQQKEERAVNLAGGYCLRNLINRLYTGR